MGFFIGCFLWVIFKFGFDWLRFEFFVFKFGFDWLIFELFVFGGGVSGNFKCCWLEFGVCCCWLFGVLLVVYLDLVVGFVSFVVLLVVYWGCCFFFWYGLMLLVWIIIGFDCFECWIWKSILFSFLIIIYGLVYFFDSFNFFFLLIFGWFFCINFLIL